LIDLVESQNGIIARDQKVEQFVSCSLPVDASKELQANRARGDKFFDLCAAWLLDDYKKNSPDQFEKKRSVLFSKLRLAMNCAECHNDSRQIKSALRPPFESVPRDLHAAPPGPRTMLSHSIENGDMPPGNNLDSDQRKVLSRCLISEYWKGAEDTPSLIREYLNGAGDCSVTVGSSPPPPTIAWTDKLDAFPLGSSAAANSFRFESNLEKRYDSYG
jgi:hypothetical protein